MKIPNWVLWISLVLNSLLWGGLLVAVGLEGVLIGEDPLVFAGILTGVAVFAFLLGVVPGWAILQTLRKE